MVKVFKNKWFWVGAVIVILIIGYFWLAAGKSTVVYTTEPVKRANIIQTVTATGEVQSATEINLNFKNSGWLARLNVKVGDKVKAGQELAQLQNGSLVASVMAAQANLTKVLAGTAAEDIKIYEQSVAKEQAALDTLLSKRDQDLVTSRNKVLDALNNANFAAAVALNTVYKDLIDTNNISNLNVMQTSLYNNISPGYSLANSKLISAKNFYTTAASTRNDLDIIAAVNATKEALNQLTILLSNSFEVADSIILNSTYTQSKKDTIKTEITTEQGNTNANLTAVETARATLVNGAASYESQIKTQQAALAYAQAQLAQKQAPAKQYDVDYYRAQLLQAQANLGDTIIRAPIDGVITKKNYEVGDQVSQTNPVLVMMGNSNLEIEVNIPESDVAKLKVGQSVDITLDAFGEDIPFKGQVTFIDPAATKISDVVYYKTKVTLDDNKEAIKPGMTANLTITTANRENVLVTLQRAVISKDGQKTVQVLVAGQPVEKPVELGLWGDEGLVEVLSGLTEGEQVVTFTKK